MDQRPNPGSEAPPAPAKTEARPGLPRWRRVLVATLATLSVILAPLAVISVWVRNQVLDTSTYVDTIAPLSSNPAIIRTTADRLTQQLFTRVNVEREIKDALPSRAQFLADPLAGALKEATRTATVKVLESDQFQTVWREANRAAHQLVDAALTGGGKVISTQDGKVVLDLSPIVRTVKSRLSDLGLTVFDSVSLNKLNLKFELFDARQLQRAQTGVRLLDRLRIVLVALVFLFLGVALALSGNRRRTLIRWGLGLAIAMGITIAGFALGRTIYLDAVSSTQLPRDTAAAAFDTVLRFLRNGLRALFVIGVVVAVGAFLTGPSRAAVAIRKLGGRVVTGVGKEADEVGWRAGPVGVWVGAHKTVLRFAGLGLALLMLVLWNRPSPAVVLALGLALVLYLGIIEFLGRPPSLTPGRTGGSAT